MKLVTDTNVLVRCVRGRASLRVAELRRRGALLLVPHHNVEELFNVLVGKIGLNENEALVSGAAVLRPFEVLDPSTYIDWHPVAERRLRLGGKSDWPVLSAAIAFDCAIWSEDVDYFGTGVPVWSSANVLESTATKEASGNA